MKNIGMVSVSENYLMRVLGYKGAKLIEIKYDYEIGVHMVKFVIEHPSMPETREGDYLVVTDTVQIREF